MAVSAAERAYVLDLFHDLGDVTARAMMGALAIYAGGRIFALYGQGERLYLKAAGPFAAELAAEGSEQFAYARPDGKTVRMGYWTLPETALDDPAEACAWARRALAAAEAD